jgi:hypothetical protein
VNGRLLGGLEILTGAKINIIRRAFARRNHSWRVGTHLSSFTL